MPVSWASDSMNSSDESIIWRPFCNHPEVVSKSLEAFPHPLQHPQKHRKPTVSPSRKTTQVFKESPRPLRSGKRWANMRVRSPEREPTCKREVLLWKTSFQSALKLIWLLQLLRLSSKSSKLVILFSKAKSSKKCEGRISRSTLIPYPDLRTIICNLWLWVLWKTIAPLKPFPTNPPALPTTPLATTSPSTSSSLHLNSPPQRAPPPKPTSHFSAERTAKPSVRRPSTCARARPRHFVRGVVGTPSSRPVGRFFSVV